MSEHQHVWVDTPDHPKGFTAVCSGCDDAWQKGGAIVEVIHPGTPEWDESELELEQQRRRGG